jgi:ATP/ADP translocase
MNFQADRLAKSLNIHPGETRLVSLSFLFYFFLCLPFSLYYSAAYALFIDEFGSQGLPYYYLAMSIVVPLVTLLLLQVSRRLPQARYLRILVVLLIIGTAFFWLGAALTTSRVIIFGLLIWKDLHFGIFTVVFWNTANSLFDVRQGRRLFPLLGVAYALADIIGGLLIPSFVALFGTANLILLAAIVQGIALIVQRRVYRLSNFEGKKELHPENPARAASLTKTLRKPFPLMLFGVVALY